MKLLAHLRSFLFALTHRSVVECELEREMDEELRSHIALHADDLVHQQAIPRAAAERRARIELGSRETVKEECREARSTYFLETLLRDIRFGCRTLRKNPGFAAVAILTLALGIGANTAVFSVVNIVLLHPLPYPEPDRIVQLETSVPANGSFPAASIPKYLVWREQTQAFEDATLYDGGHRINLTGGDRPEQLGGMRVSAGYFRLFGARLARGRTFVADEDVPNGPRVAVISSALWRNRYGGDAGIVGKNIEIDGEPYQLIGVLDASFRWVLRAPWDPPVDVWLPLQADPNSANQNSDLLAAARLKPGVSLDQARAAMSLAYQTFRLRFPNAAAGQGFTAGPLEDDEVTTIRPALLLLAGTVVFVLLIACVNVANLHLARAAVRRHEFIVRAALGAGRLRILRQLLTESVLLSIAGGALGLTLGYFGMRALLSMDPGNIPRIEARGPDVVLDWRVLLFTLAVSLFTGIVFGLIPAIEASRPDLNVALDESGSRSGGGPRRNKARATLVVTETALALILMAGSALLIRTYIALRAVAPGFDPHNLLTMDMSLDSPRFQKTAAVDRLVRDGVARIESLPGVEAAATSSSLPLEPTFHDSFTIEGRPVPKDGYHGAAAWRMISPNYFKVFRIPLLQGRWFTDRDNAGTAPVVLINRTMAARFWPAANPIGERITIDKDAGPPFADLTRQIVGVVADVQADELNRALLPTMYTPESQLSDALTALDNQDLPAMWVIRTKVAPASLSADIQRALRDASKGVPLGHIRPMEQVLVESTARSDFNTTLLTSFAGLALLLAAIGIYGVMSYSVAHRTHEIGVRMALGAQRCAVLKMVVGNGLKLALIGAGLGVLGALGLTRLLASLLFGVGPTDPATFIIITLLLLAVALFACYIPARRATRVDPAEALRYE